MKFFKYLVLAIVPAMFFACGDSGDSDSGSNAPGRSSEEVASGQVSINEKKKIIEYYTQRSLEGCFQKGLNFSWKTVDLKVDSVTYKYEFVDDTLVLHRGTSYGESGWMFVGGSEDDLNGTWKSTLCYYSHENAESVCKRSCSEVKTSLLKKYKVSSKDELDDEELEEFEEKMDNSKCIDDEDITDVTLKISEPNITITETYRTAEREDFDDYMNSYFIGVLYESIYEGSSYVPSIFSLGQEASAMVQKYKRKADIEEKSRSKNSLKFEVEGYPISVKVNEYSYNNSKARISMTVTMEDFAKEACEVDYEAGVVTSSECNKDNSSGFEQVSVEDDEGTKYKYIPYMENSTEDDFEVCMNRALTKLAKAIHGDDDSMRKTAVEKDLSAREFLKIQRNTLIDLRRVIK